MKLLISTLFVSSVLLSACTSTTSHMPNKQYNRPEVMENTSPNPNPVQSHNAAANTAATMISPLR